MGDNEPRFAIVSGVNAVYGDWNPHLDLPSDVAAIELGIVVGPMLADVDYVTDYSGPSPSGLGLRRYRGLDDVLDRETLASTRARLTRLLEALLDEGESWFLFVHGQLDDGLPEPDAKFSGRVHADPLNGAFTILEVPAGELDGYAPLFGACDRVSGLAAAANSFATLLSRLSLAAAVPTGQRYRFGSPFQISDTSALTSALEHGRLFFEEIDNGTRLRLIAPTHASAALRERLTTAMSRLETSRIGGAPGGGTGSG